MMIRTRMMAAGAALALMAGGALAQDSFGQAQGADQQQQQQQTYPQQQQQQGYPQQQQGFPQQPNVWNEQTPQTQGGQPQWGQQQPQQQGYPQQQQQQPWGGQPQQQPQGYPQQQQQPQWGGQQQQPQQQPQQQAGGNLDQLMQMERQDYGVQATSQLHSGAMHGPTPASIPGGQVITTKGLVSLVQGQQTPYFLFDVLGGPQTLPGAIPAAWTSQPGSFNDQIQQQFSQMLTQGTQGRKDMPLVFYCLSTQCWMSYNAALRAINAGFTNVLWYRGGIEAWQAAGFPLQPAPQQGGYQQQQQGGQQQQQQYGQPY